MSSVLIVALGAMQPSEPADAAKTRGEIRSVESLLPTLSHRGAALFFLARRYAHLGDSRRALALLKQSVALDEGFEPADVPEFEPLASDPEFMALAAEARRRRVPVQRARVAFTVQQPDLFPEGLAYDAAAGVFYMGSMHLRKILKITESGEVSDFVKPGIYNLAPVGGIKVDTADHSVFAASDSAEFVHVDAHGALLERYSVADGRSHILNDLVLRGPREVYLTDTRANEVYRFDRESHTFSPMTFDRPVFGPNGIALSADANLLFVADLLGVIVVDLRSGVARDIDPGPRNTLAGIDGLYWRAGELLAVQYGTGSFRVARFALSADGRRVTSAETLEYRTPLLSFPTTGAVVGDRFYFIANTGIGNLRQDAIIDPEKLEPVHVAVVSLSGKSAGRSR